MDKFDKAAFRPGAWFPNRVALSESGLHRPPQAGIAGGRSRPAESIVLSGGYEDDEDFGTFVVCTGQGGRDPQTGLQVEHQNLTRGNAGLALSSLAVTPVRVIRGAGNPSSFSPRDGYRYDGLYRVTDYWRERGRSGYFVWRSVLRQSPGVSYRRYNENSDYP
jgi:putative restriction endonuclease